MCANLQGYPHSPLKKARCRKKKAKYRQCDPVFMYFKTDIHIYVQKFSRRTHKTCKNGYQWETWC